MKERPILFSGEMVRAILEGRKTQTRRIVGTRGVDPYMKQPFITDVIPDVKDCYIKESDLLWVRETWWCESNSPVSPDSPSMFYRANQTDDEWAKNFKWKPSIHMPRWASRITLKVTSVRVERLNEISARDCEAEGITVPASGYSSQHNRDITLQVKYRSLWESIYGKSSWETTPWVWVIEFELVGTTPTTTQEER